MMYEDYRSIIRQTLLDSITKENIVYAIECAVENIDFNGILPQLLEDRINDVIAEELDNILDDII